MYKNVKTLEKFLVISSWKEIGSMRPIWIKCHSVKDVLLHSTPKYSRLTDCLFDATA